MQVTASIIFSAKALETLFAVSVSQALKMLEITNQRSAIN